MKIEKIQEEDKKLLKEAFDSLFVDNINETIKKNGDKGDKVLNDLNEKVDFIRTEIIDVNTKLKKINAISLDLQEIDENINSLKPDVSQYGKNSVETQLAIEKIQVEIININTSIKSNEKSLSDLYKKNSELGKVGSDIQVIIKQFHDIKTLRDSIKATKTIVYIVMFISIIILLFTILNK